MSGVHGEQQEFECSVCDYTTKYKDNLKKHMIIHTGGQEYSMWWMWIGDKRSQGTEESQVQRKDFWMWSL